MYGNIRNQQFLHNSPVISAGPQVASSSNGSHIPQGGAPFAQVQQMLSLTQQPPPPHPVPAPQSFVEKLPIGLDHAPHSFNLREKVIGAASANLQYISKETGVQITLRGVGSLFVETSTSAESQEPLHLFLEHQRFENLSSAKQLAKNLIETLHQEYLQYQQVAGPQALPSTQIPPPQLNVPPPNVIASVPPPSVTAPLAQHQQLSLVQQQQYVPQNGLQMQLAQNGMIIQQQPPNLSMPPPPTTQSTMLPMKPTNHIQLQFHQPPPTLPTQQAPIILNTQPQSIQYQYYQQTTTRDMQGNQQVTLQPFIQQSSLPLQPHQQYITLQQGNTAYMVPQSTFIQQAPIGTQPSTQFSIIQQQVPTTQQTAQLQMQLPLMNVQPTTQHVLPATQRLDMKNDTQSGAQDADSLSQEDSSTELQVNSSSDQLNTIVARQPQLTMPITSVPPPPLNMSVPPPVHSNLLAGNAAVSINMQQMHQPASVLVDNTNNWPQAHIPPPPLGQPLTEMQTQQAIGQQQPVAVTFSQQPLQQTTQQFVQLQQQHNQQQQQQFSIVQATPINNNNNAFQQQQILQIQQLQPNAMQLQQQQQQLMLQQQQINFQLQQQQLSAECSNQARTGQKRRSTSEQETSASGGPPPSQQIRTGMGSQSSCLNNIAVTLTSAAVGNASNVAEAVGVSGQADQSAINNSNSAKTGKYPQQQQHLKPTHVGVMRYNHNPQRPVYDTAYPPPRSRMTNYNNIATANQYNAHPPSQQHQKQQQQQLQLRNNNYGQRMQFMHSQPPPPLPATDAFGTGAGLKRMPRP